ncbi:glutamate racemase [Limnohabitans sp. 63ED37-2]|uniref:glutamate racemase n=1 Tax=Limnohabitans sp. 63ED37-2 TaxID=1678128 RepID=UPI00070687AE|nr:glutamate racemase [Limnohabitans sp. 63ED37-2]ALK88262.1 Glutamate racemase [Limnohabitans sp. 63ED37-2]
MTSDQRPIGVFDSGIGGLSVLRALQQELPNERFVYLADNAHAPYGEKSEDFVSQRTHAIAQFLQTQHQIKALVVACNTATAAAIQGLRAAYPTLPLVGVEPALKPALALSTTRRIGVIATRGTVGSEKFSRLLASVQDEATFVVQACNGLALAIEQSTLPDPSHAAQAQITHLLQNYTQAMGRFGSASGDIDTLVLGCTHYVFVENDLRTLLGPNVQLVSTGAPVARQTYRLLAAAGLLNAAQPKGAAPTIRLLTTGDLKGLQAAAQRWLSLPEEACEAVPASL